MRSRYFLQIFSWEPLRCHDMVDVGWHKLVDLSIHEGKLLGCSFNQSCVGVWVVDLQVRLLYPFSPDYFSTRNIFQLIVKLMQNSGTLGSVFFMSSV